jgi:hypothetical protein
MPDQEKIETTRHDDSEPVVQRSAAEWTAIGVAAAIGLKPELKAGAAKIADKISGGEEKEPKP